MKVPHDWRLNLPGNARVSTLAFSIWKAGVVPWSWAFQLPPDFLDLPIEDRIRYAVDAFVQRIEHDNALLSEIERAREIAAAQGREIKFAHEETPE